MRLPAGAVVRGRRPGDRLQPAGMRGHKKLQDYYVDRKVPRRERDAAPVIACRARRAVDAVRRGGAVSDEAGCVSGAL